MHISKKVCQVEKFNLIFFLHVAVISVLAKMNQGGCSEFIKNSLWIKCPSVRFLKPLVMKLKILPISFQSNFTKKFLNCQTHTSTSTKLMVPTFFVKMQMVYTKRPDMWMFRKVLLTLCFEEKWDRESLLCIGI